MRNQGGRPGSERSGRFGLRRRSRTKRLLGLAVEPGIGPRPEGPGVACRITLRSTEGKPEAVVEMATSNGNATAWAAAGKFTLPAARRR